LYPRYASIVSKPYYKVKQNRSRSPVHQESAELKNRHAWGIILLGVLVAVPFALAEPPVLESLRLVFHPYSSELLHPEGITPGARIDQHNWQAATSFLPTEILQLIQ